MTAQPAWEPSVREELWVYLQLHVCLCTPLLTCALACLHVQELWSF